MRKTITIPREYFFLCAICLWTVLSRILCKARYLYDWDSVQYTLALNKFDMSIHQPHPPGYPLYVAVGKLLNYFIASGIDSYFVAGILYSLGGIVFLFYLGKEFSGRNQVGLIASLLFSVNYTFWQYGEFPNTYVADVAGVALFAYLIMCYLNNFTAHKFLYAAGFVLGFVGGFRENTTVFLLPVLFFSLIYARAGKVKSLIAIILYLAGIALWFVPLVYQTGGLERYLNLTFIQAFFCASKTSVLIGAMTKELSANFSMMFLWLFTGLNILLLPFLWLAVKKVRASSLKLVFAKKNLFILIWTMPSILFYLFFHLSKPGYLFTFLPAVYLVVAISLTRFSAVFSQISRNGSKVVLIALIAVHCMISALYFYNAGFSGIRENDAFINGLLTQVGKYDKTRTILVMAQVGPLKPLKQDAMIGMWRQAMYYLPEYKLYRLGVENNLCGDNLSFGRAFQTLRSREIHIDRKIGNILLLLDSEEFVKDKFSGYTEIIDLPLQKKIIVFKNVTSLKLGAYTITNKERI